jgi:hypothetical protein
MGVPATDDDADRGPHPPRACERVDLPRKRERCTEHTERFRFISQILKPLRNRLILPEKRPSLF